LFYLIRSRNPNSSRLQISKGRSPSDCRFQSNEGKKGQSTKSKEWRTV
jgi:hypothetical protein